MGQVEQIMIIRDFIAAFAREFPQYYDMPLREQDKLAELVEEEVDDIVESEQLSYEAGSEHGYTRGFQRAKEEFRGLLIKLVKAKLLKDEKLQDALIEGIQEMDDGS